MAAPAIEQPVTAPEAVEVSALVNAVEIPAAVSETVAVETVATAAPKTLSNEEIARLAYSYWVQRGYQPGNPEEDWVRAEQTLRAMAAAG